jgi:hypothetical protein
MIQHPTPRATITLEQYRALNLTRPLSDKPIGAHTAGKRAADALASEAVQVTPHRKLQPVEKLGKQPPRTYDNCGDWGGIAKHQRNHEHQCEACSAFRRTKYQSRRKSA